MTIKQIKSIKQGGTIMGYLQLLKKMGEVQTKWQNHCEMLLNWEVKTTKKKGSRITENDQEEKEATRNTGREVVETNGSFVTTYSCNNNNETTLSYLKEMEESGKHEKSSIVLIGHEFKNGTWIPNQGVIYEEFESIADIVNYIN